MVEEKRFPGLGGADPAGAPGWVIGLLGPTGVGKTAVGVELARRLGTRVISCDSMQVYEGFPVLTNQPAASDTGTVVHELVGCVDPDEDFSVGEYARIARPLIERELAASGSALLVGGTGLYMRAALAPLAACARADEGIRARLENRAGEEGPSVLYAELQEVDPAAAQVIDPRNLRRVVRALEAVIATGRAWSGRDDLWAPAYHHPTVVVGLTLERTALYGRIDARAADIVRGGAVEEVRRHREESRRDDGAEHDRARPGPAAGGDHPRSGIIAAIGYREICRYLDGEVTLEETISLVAAATRRYARRQLTWLRKLGDAIILDVAGKTAEETAAEVLDIVQRRRREKGLEQA